MTDLLFADDDLDHDDDVSGVEDMFGAPAPVVVAEPDRPRGYEAIEAQLLNAVNADRMPHALIFAGEAGRGKETTAFRLARALLSLKKAWPAQDFDVAATDPIISRVESGAHPDMLVMRRGLKENKSGLAEIIGINAVREATQFLTLKPLESAYRVVIVDEAHLLSIDAQNAFLKTLEEPPARTVLILIAHQPARLLPTIRSRAQLINFPPLSANLLLEHAEGGFRALAKDTQDVILRLSRGGIGAFKKLQSADVVAGIDKIRALLPKATPIADVYAFSESWGTTQIEGVDPMLLLEEVLFDDLRHNLLSNLEHQDIKDQSFDKIDALQELLGLARSRNLDKRQTIRHAFGIIHD